ncbi:rhodopsin [Glaciihabitans sp. INWT7]|uniref:bacteriorhodopsin n=1 Tax=Glaciihabitans sp. INWT7 TaxID=2596912 RepID=UPI001626E589|nr:bacteriorhodopsin [Glaciihabitans sp. INWT7]QNE47319.1 rhodopsin [Glaciihabitans sp. INWT7]
MIHASTAPWNATLTQPEYLLSLYFLVIAGLALFAGFLRTWTTRNEVGSRYRGAVVARLSITIVASLSYVLIVVEFLRGYDVTGNGYRPNAQAILAFAPRFMDWSITVPLLTVELLAVSTLVGATARRTQWLAGGGAFLMIFTGFLGTFIIGGGEDTAQLLLWGGISGVFWIFTSVVLIRSVRVSARDLTTEAAQLLRQATALLLGGWAIYPLVFLIHIFAFGGGWTTTMQVALCATDVVVKIGFGGLVHRIAKLRTAEDVRAGDDVHPESIWISSVKQSDAGAAREVYLSEGAIIHPRRSRPPSNSAVAAVPDPEVLDLDD